MRTKQEIMADAGGHFAELNQILVTADLPAFPFETVYADVKDVLNFDEGIVDRWFNVCMKKTEELGAAIPTGEGFHPLMLQFKLQLQFIETVCEIHTRLLKLLIITEASEVTLH